MVADRVPDDPSRHELDALWGAACDELRAAVPESTFRLLKDLTAGQPCDMSGIESYEMIAAAGGVQWPLRAGEPLPARERRLFEDGRFFHGDGKARFVFDAPRPLPEPADARYPFTLLTGRGSWSQWQVSAGQLDLALLQGAVGK